MFRQLCGFVIYNKPRVELTICMHPRAAAGTDGTTREGKSQSTVHRAEEKHMTIISEGLNLCTEGEDKTFFSKWILERFHKRNI